MQEQEARAVLTKADAQLLKVKASAGEARSALQAGTLDMAAASHGSPTRHRPGT